MPFNPRFIFFALAPEGRENRELTSALQTFETALVLISLELYPNALVDMSSANEKVIKASSLSVPQKNFKSALDAAAESSALIAKFVGDGSLTKEFRDLRNQVEHQGFSPADDQPCIDMMLRVGLPLFELCTRELHDLGLSKNIRRDMGFWPALRAAMEIHRDAFEAGCLETNYCFRAFQRITGRTLYPVYLTDHEYALIQGQYESGAHFHDSADEQRRELESKAEIFWEFDNCPVCGHFQFFADLICKNEDPVEFGLNYALCPECGFDIRSHEIEPFHAAHFIDPLIERQKQEIASGYGLL